MSSAANYAKIQANAAAAAARAANRAAWHRNFHAREAAARGMTKAEYAAVPLKRQPAMRGDSCNYPGPTTRSMGGPYGTGEGRRATRRRSMRRRSTRRHRRSN